MFSSRTPGDLTPNRLADTLAAARAGGRTILDLTESNPTRAGFEYPDRSASPARGFPRTDLCARALRPADARAAVARDYARRGLSVTPERIALTASTSEAYGCLFKLLADAGDEVLVPRPSYPLFDHLARLELVTARPVRSRSRRRLAYRLRLARERADPAHARGSARVAQQSDRLVRHTPTSSSALPRSARPASCAVIADEVFADYELDAGRARVRRPRAGTTRRPGVLARRAVEDGRAAAGEAGVDRRRRPGRAASMRRSSGSSSSATRILSVSTPVQVAAAELLDRGAIVREQIAGRVAANYRWLSEHVAGDPGVPRAARARAGGTRSSKCRPSNRRKRSWWICCRTTAC